MTEDLQNLEDRRDRLNQKLPSFGDFRLGMEDLILERTGRCGGHHQGGGAYLRGHWWAD